LVDKPITQNQPPINYQDFGDFCFTLADRFKGRIRAYQVWNEPNLSREWGEQSPSPAEYTELLRVCYIGIKTADPNAIVVSAGLAPTGTQPPLAMPDTDFLQGMYDAGAADYFDALGLNAPGYKAPPELSPEEGLNQEWGGYRWNVFRHVEDMREIMVANGDADKQVVILETGWILSQELHPSYTWFGVSEAQQAEYLVGAYQFARENWQPWIGPIFAIYISDFDWTPEGNEQYWWSIVLPDGTPRPAYLALKEMSK
jgi:polysaccharide biosynthesis protein PslG